MALDNRSQLVDFSQSGAAALAAEQAIAAATAPDGLTVRLGQEQGDALSLPIPEFIPLADWTSFDTLALELTNTEEREAVVTVTLRSERGSHEHGKAAWFSARIAPSARAIWRIPIQHLRYTEVWGWPWGFASQPGLTDLTCQGRVNTHQMAEVAIAIRRADGADESERTITFHRLALEGPIASWGWVDQYGQRTNAEWPAKVKKDDDIKQADKQEATELAKLTPFPGRDEFQAWADSPVLKATGFFRVEEVEGRWWFVAPNGRLFYAIGIDCVGAGADGPQNDLVPEAYSWRPEKEGEFAHAWSSSFYQGRDLESGGLSMYRANLIRKWGPERLRERASERAQKRQLAWGFTCLANWTDPGILREARLPYFTTGPDMKQITIPEVSRHIMDVYDPRFEQQAQAAAAPLAKVQDDPLIVGHFVDNEIGWRDFPGALIAMPADQPARAELSRFLRQRYGHIGALSTAWGVEASSFDELSWPAMKSEVAEGDLSAFRGEFAERYYRIWAEVVREADPNHLVLGSRMQGGNRPDEVVAACGRHMDVVSFNHYQYGPNREEFDRLFAIAGKPFIIGEYGFNSMDEGLLTAAVPVADQEERGIGYRYYTEQLAAIPYYLGGHYFQYLDEPITGRFDTECSFNGFVRVTDIPYPTLVEAAKATNARIYRIHAGKEQPFDRAPKR